MRGIYHSQSSSASVRVVYVLPAEAEDYFGPRNKIIKIMVGSLNSNLHNLRMTTTRRLLLAVSTLFVPYLSLAAPPAELTGRFVSLKGDRFEFHTVSGGTNGADSVTYTYSVTDATNASLVVNYPSGRQRSVTLTFLADGSPLEYREFDLVSINPPMPPIFRSGTFEIGLLEVTPPPPLDSSAPDELTGLYLQTGKKRLEFLTGDRGRHYLPGRSDYFTYVYTITDEDSARVALTYETDGRTALLDLDFDAQGRPVSFTATEEKNGAPLTTTGKLAMGTNRHLADLQIGTDVANLVGNDHFSAIGLYQTVGQRGDDKDPLDYTIALQNDGDTDTFRLRGSRARSHFRVEYYTYASRENVTAAMVAGTLEVGELGHGGTATLTMELTPLRANGAFLGEISARSLSVPEARDAVHSLTLVKARSKNKSGKKRSR